jgi:hypothetical protein
MLNGGGQCLTAQHKNKTLCQGVFKSSRTESITIYTLTFGITRSEVTQRVMAAKVTRLTRKIEIQLHLVAESLYHLQFSVQAASPETFGYTLVTSSEKVQSLQIEKCANIDVIIVCS